MSREWYPKSVLLSRRPERPGFSAKPIDETKNTNSDIQRILSNKKKLFFDNSEPYGHLLTLWLA